MKKCEKCNGRLIPIVYGLPSGKMFRDAERGKVKLGGCMVSPENPSWYCKNCDGEDIEP
jgi:hypothetical protein